MRVFAIRGATTADSNSVEEILHKTEQLITKILDKNNLPIKDIISVIFTMTQDLDAVYPSVAARTLGITQAALLNFPELPIPGSLEKCIRVMIHCYLPEDSVIRHTYLEGAANLRPDLKENE